MLYARHATRNGTAMKRKQTMGHLMSITLVRCYNVVGRTVAYGFTNNAISPRSTTHTWLKGLSNPALNGREATGRASPGHATHAHNTPVRAQSRSHGSARRLRPLPLPRQTQHNRNNKLGIGYACHAIQSPPSSLSTVQNPHAGSLMRTLVSIALMTTC